MTSPTSPRRIALVISSMRDPGGTQRVVAVLAEHWRQQGHEVAIITLTSEEGELPHSPGGIEVESVAPGRLGTVRRNSALLLSMRRAIVRRRIDVVVAFLDTTNVLARLATLGLPARVVLCERLTPGAYPLPWIWRVLRAVTYRMADRVTVQTSRAAKALGGVPTVVVPNFVMSDVFTIERDERDGARVLAVGRLAPQKGFDVLLEAFAIALRSRPDATLTIAGEGPSRGELEAQIERLGIAHAVSLPGFVRDMRTLYAEADVFAMTSRHEGFPNALIEAFGAALPSVVTDCPSGPAELVRDGENGFLVAVDDVGATANRLYALLNNAELRRRLGSAARESVRPFAPSIALAVWDEIFLERPRATLRSRINGD